MLHIHLVTIGKKMPDWVEAAYSDYTKRLSPHCQMHLVDIDSRINAQKLPPEVIQEKESALLLEATPPRSHIVALDRSGQNWSTETLAEKMAAWQQLGNPISLWIGGPEGIAPQYLKKAQQTWSLSALTFPHPLVRVILAEQLYRGMSILKNHPYHRGL